MYDEYYDYDYYQRRDQEVIYCDLVEEAYEYARAHPEPEKPAPRQSLISWECFLTMLGLIVIAVWGGKDAWIFSVVMGVSILVVDIVMRKNWVLGGVLLAAFIMFWVAVIGTAILPVAGGR